MAGLLLLFLGGPAAAGGHPVVRGGVIGKFHFHGGPHIQDCLLYTSTGTNGKTTTTYLLKGVLEAVCQTKVGLIGTNQNLIGQQALPAQRTTPDAYTLQSLLARMEDCLLYTSRCV